jgi:hypothetical protein
LLLLVIIALFAKCNNNTQNTKVITKKSETFAYGDRRGADPSLINLENEKSLSKLISQRWDNKEDKEDTKYASSGNGDLEMVFRSFYFFNDGTLVKNARDEMVYGTWVYNDTEKLIAVTLANGKKESYKIKAIAYDELILVNAQDGKPITYVADGFVYGNNGDDPFYKTNQQWRVQPKKNETDAEIKNRVGAMLNFYTKYLADNTKKNASSISFFGLPDCFKWYDGGIGLKKEADVSSKWKKCFYNNQNASKAYSYLDNLITKKYNWKKEETNWIKQSEDVLYQMKAKLDSL